MPLKREMAEEIFQKLRSVQPVSFQLTNHRGIILASDDEDQVGRRDSRAAACCMRPFNEAVSCALDAGCGTVIPFWRRNRVAGTIILEQTADEKAQACLPLMKAVVELMLERKESWKLQEEEHSSKNDVISLLIGVHPRDTRPLLQELERCNIDLSTPRTSLLLQLSKRETLDLPSGEREIILDEKQYDISVRRFLDGLFGYFPYQQDLCMIDPAKANAVILATDRARASEDNAMSLFELCRKLEEIAERDYCLTFQAVVGIRCTAFSDYERQYEQLNLRLASGKMLYPERNVFLGNSIVLGNFITHTSRKILHNITTYVYQKLLNSKEREVLLETLRIYYESDMNLTQTAKKLYIHKNTVQHRLKRIEELTGFSVRTADGLLTLRMALLCYSRLKAKDSAPPNL